MRLGAGSRLAGVFVAVLGLAAAAGADTVVLASGETLEGDIRDERFELVAAGGALVLRHAQEQRRRRLEEGAARRVAGVPPRSAADEARGPCLVGSEPGVPPAPLRAGPHAGRAGVPRLQWLVG